MDIQKNTIEVYKPQRDKAKALAERRSHKLGRRVYMHEVIGDALNVLETLWDRQDKKEKDAAV